jgi:transcriptional regulator with XRE-family HTH domain
MTIEELSVGELAARAGFSKSSVRKHMNPKGFNDLSISKLKRYADVLNIPVANMFQIINTKEEMNWNVGYAEELHESETVQISQIKTDNPIIVETKIVQNTK